MVSALKVLGGAALAASVFAKDYGYVDDVKCTMAGKKCAGAPGKPFVEYAPCCDEDKVCMPDESLGWGNWCISAPEGYEVCYAKGERAVGAEGYDYVPYHPCCAGYPVTIAGEWGQFCHTPTDYVEKYYVYYPETPKMEEAKVGYKYIGSYDASYAPTPEMPGYKKDYKEYSYTPTYGTDSYPSATTEYTPEPTSPEYGY